MPVRSTTSAKPTPKTTTPKTTTGPSSKNLKESAETVKQSFKSLGWVAKAFKKEGVKMSEAAKQQGTKALDTLEKHGVKFENRHHADSFETPKKKG